MIGEKPNNANSSIAQMRRIKLSLLQNRLISSSNVNSLAGNKPTISSDE
jgi:hypothetical protein